MPKLSSDDIKRAAAARAVLLVEDGMRLGLGTGSTAAHFVALLGARLREERLSVVAVPTSEQTGALATRAGVPLTTLDETPELDLVVDGADELDEQLRLIKGGGGALLREKIVAAAGRRMIVIADGSKRVGALGGFPLPIEVVRFGLGVTERAVSAALARSLGRDVELRRRHAADESLFVTDEGHHILDARCGPIHEPAALAAVLGAIPGVVEHGLFLGLASGAILGLEDGGLVELGQV